MATTKKRINISLSGDVEKTLTYLAKRDRIPEATKAGELLRVALEIEEDQVLDAMASGRYKKNKKMLSHSEVWK